MKSSTTIHFEADSTIETRVDTDMILLKIEHEDAELRLFTFLFSDDQKDERIKKLRELHEALGDAIHEFDGIQKHKGEVEPSALPF